VAREPAEVHESIFKEFSENGIVGHPLLEVIDAERAYQRHVIAGYRGHRLVYDAFQQFTLETIVIASKPEQLLPGERALLLLQLLVTFRNLRAADNTFLAGYPISAVALLRDLKDRAIFNAAIAKGITTSRALEGIHQHENLDLDAISRDRRLISRRARSEQVRVRAAMKQAISQTDREEIDRWEEMFHAEIHGARATRSLESDRDIETRSAFISPAPVPRTTSIAFYLNRSLEVAWMQLRGYCYLQKAPRAFGGDWARRWKVLDDALRDHVTMNDKPIFSAIGRFVESVMDFDPGRTWYADR
jgi:hypothetical protein